MYIVQLILQTKKPKNYVLGFLDRASGFEKYKNSVNNCHKLHQSYLTSHDEFCLMLLRSSSDMVHKSPLHKTLISTFAARRSLFVHGPGPAFNPAVADCGQRAPPAPRLARSLSILARKPWFCNTFFCALC